MAAKMTEHKYKGQDTREAVADDSCGLRIVWRVDWHQKAPTKGVGGGGKRRRSCHHGVVTSFLTGELVRTGLGVAGSRNRMIPWDR